MKACAPNNLLCYYTENDVSARAQAVVRICSTNYVFLKILKVLNLKKSFTFDKVIGLKACKFIKKDSGTCVYL